MPKHEYEILLRNGDVENVSADYADEKRYKVSFYRYCKRRVEDIHEIKISNLEGEIYFPELIAEYALSQIVRWRRVSE